jgi:hypothetical protein
MAQFRFARDDEPAPEDPVNHGVSIAVRATGVVLLLVGLGVAIRVMFEAWGLYAEPVRIERLAAAIERGSGLDKALNAQRPAALEPKGLASLEPPEVPGAPGATPLRAAAAGDAEPQPEIRLSYFVAWAVAVVLLLLVGRLSIAAIRTGGELALYDLRLKEIARSLVREAARGKN